MATHPAGQEGGNDALHCVVVTPERTLFDERVEFVALPLFDGEIGVLPGRAPFIGRLGYGELRTRAGDVTQLYFVDGGFVQVRDDIITVLTNHAIPAPRLRAEAATQELEKARARVARTDAQQTAKERAIERARAQLRIVARLR